MAARSLSKETARLIALIFMRRTLAIWLWTILFKGQSCRPYNVGSDESLSIIEVANRVARCFSPEIAMKIRGKANQENVLERYVPDIQREKNELNLQVWIGINDGIHRSLESIGST